MKLIVPCAALCLLGACSPSPDAQPSAVASEPAITPGPVASASAEASEIPPVALPIPQQFKALGTEPFWSASVDGNRLTYSTPVTPEGATITVTRNDRSEPVVYTGSIGGKPLRLEISRRTCSDGMSDTVYPFSVIRQIGPDMQAGCAR